MIRPEQSLLDISPSEVNENGGLRSDVKSASVLEDSSDAALDQSGVADCPTDPAPASMKRKRGRPPAPHHLQAERRKEKLREVLCNDNNC